MEEGVQPSTLGLKVSCDVKQLLSMDENITIILWLLKKEQKTYEFMACCVHPAKRHC